MNKKIVIGIVVTIIVIVLAVAGGVIAYRMTRDTSKPEDVLIKYVGYVNEQNYEEMYKLLTNDSKEQISKEDFITRNKNIYEGIDMTDMKIEITNVTEENSKTYVISYNQSMNSEAGKIEFENTANVIKDKELGYQLNWKSSLIFPNLSSTDKVKQFLQKEAALLIKMEICQLHLVLYLLLELFQESLEKTKMKI